MVLMETENYKLTWKGMQQGVESEITAGFGSMGFHQGIYSGSCL